MTKNIHPKYANYKLIKRFFRKDRLYIQLESPDGRTETLPLANYNWLSANPIFLGIPQGYVIHHLDNDPMNDDVSNLALMGKHHHRAHHLKHKNIDIPCEFSFEVEDNSVQVYGIPERRPRVRPVHRKGRPVMWRILYSVRTPDGFKQLQVNNYGGNPFYTAQAAQDALAKMWPNITWAGCPSSVE